MDQLFLAGSSPHIRSQESTARIMREVLLALAPAAGASIFFFGFRALLLLMVTVVTCLATEYGWTLLLKKKNTLWDGSAAVTGVLLGFNLPVGIPLWIAAIGGIFAIIIVKQLFGGLGHNFMNPVLAARAFMMVSWPVAMTSWVAPGIDGISTATPLALMKAGTAAVGQMPTLLNMFLGNKGGCIGETSGLALLIGVLYLVYRKVITLETPFAFITTTAMITWVLGGKTLFTGDFILSIFSGGLILGAFFMATDYTTSPITVKGRWIMGIGCGLLTAVIRLYGGYPEGVSYAILLMNLVVPLIDKATLPKIFGGGKQHASNA